MRTCCLTKVWTSCSSFSVAEQLMQINLIPLLFASVTKLKGFPVSPKMSEALLDVPSPSADLVVRSWSLHNSHTQLGPKG